MYAQVFQTLLSQQEATGAVLSGGKAYFYASGTSNLATVYTDRNMGTPAANPVTLSADGTAAVFGNGQYDVKITTSAGAQKFYWYGVSLIDAASAIANDPRISGVYDLANYASLPAAVAAIGSTRATLRHGTDLTLSADLTIPANIELQQYNGAIITIASTKTLTINGPFSAGISQVFAGSGAVVGLKEARPEWFGTGATALAKAFASAMTGNIILTSGDYSIDNSAGYFTVTSFTGKFEFRGNSRLVFSDNTKGGFKLARGTGAVILNPRIAYASAPTVRQSYEHAILLTGTTDTLVQNAYIEAAPSAGFLADECTRPRVENITVVTSKADGVHFANCQDGKAIGVATLDTGDDGLAFVNYAAKAANTGGYASGVVVRNAKARGIAVVGQSDVTINGFEVDGTSGPGIYTAYESTYSTRVPANVAWADGIVKNAGTVAPLVGNQFGIEYVAPTSVKYSGIKVIASANRGMAGTAAAGLVEIDNVTVDSPTAGNGFNLSALTLIMNGIKSINTQSYGVYVTGSGNVISSNITAVNAAITDGLKRAVWFSANTRIMVDGVNVLDNQATATGYTVGTDGGSQSGVITNIQSSFASGTLSVSDGSYPLVLIGLVNGSHANNIATSVAATPWYKGQFAIVGATIYFAVGTASSADWKALN